MGKKYISNRSGYTLVELIVTCALLVIFSVAMVYVISSSVNVYNTVTGKSNAQSVMSVIMEKVTGEIAGAQSGVKAEYTFSVMDRSSITAENSDLYLPYDDKTCVSFCNSTGSPVYMTLSNNYLLIHYRPVTDNNLSLKAVDWNFDKAVYHNYKIDSMNFEILSDDSGRKTNVIHISIEISNSKTGYKYSEDRYVECFNFSSTEMEKIKYDAIKKD